MSDRRKPKEKEPEDDYDFFAPHPHPTPDKVRVKQSFFEYMPDAYAGKSIAFSESPKKTKQPPKEEVVKPPEEEKPAEKKPEPEPVKEEILQVRTETIEANPWDTSAVVNGHDTDEQSIRKTFATDDEFSLTLKTEGTYRHGRI